MGDYPPLLVDTTAFLWKRKQKVYARSNLVLVTPSKWLLKIVKESPLLGKFPSHHIPYGVDLEIFRPLEKEAARKNLNLPKELPLILFGAAELDDHRKGNRFFFEATQLLIQNGKHDFGVMTFGIGAKSLPFPSQIKHFSFGHVADETKLAEIYSAATIFASPTLADNLPNTLIESLACGVPSVAFNSGGVNEVVSHLKTGYVATHRDSQDFARGIELILGDAKLRLEMAKKAREKAVAEFSLELQATRYLELYRGVLERAKKRN